ncbi:MULTISPECIES: murein hydrolase activator EnvC [unclassified Idiomarina]|uniref:murein hydrolase activator EnvC family protein n=1 Tax=unclassified Idiomarina TaxID=2614829 RepID=UPI0025B7B6E0|nr:MULTISPECIES: peptidoglycan DD-metalloendopeptidase family protein [unclassified Idiomarina]
MLKPVAWGLLLAFSLFSAIALAQQPTEQTKAEKQAELKAIQAEIESRLEAFESRKQALTSSQQALKKLELRTAKLAEALQNTRQRLQQLESEIGNNEAEQTRLEADIRDQLNALKDQVIAAYANGDYDYLKLLLNQQKASSLERQLTYYKYLNDARIAAIDSLKQTQAQLEQVKQALQTQYQQQTELRAEQTAQRSALTEQQEKQEQAIAKLRNEQRSEEEKIAELRSSQAELEQVIAAIEEALSDRIELIGLKPIKASLRWPTNGKVQRLFGERREGPIRWKGVLIDGEQGQSIRSIADGRVVFADWLRGFGLVIVIDHGEGYMSLYGYNQVIFKNVGEEVQQNEEIALMGQSGAQNSPALYFEIRFKGQPENPTQWIR